MYLNKENQIWFFNVNNKLTIISDSTIYVEAQNTRSRLVESQSLALRAR